MFKVINLFEHSENWFELFKNDWALVTAGTLDNHNSMTIGWGTVGILWRKKIAMIFVRDSRYTYQFTENNGYYTISFYDKKYKDALSIYGTKSGRDMDKDAACNFHPVELSEGISYQEARLVIVCKVIYKDVLRPELFLDSSINDCYQTNSYHKMYIGEIISVYENV